MSGIDIFGLKDDERKQDGEMPPLAPLPQGPRRSYKLWLALDALFLLACAGLVAERALSHWDPVATVSTRPTPRLRPRPPEPKKEEPKPPEPPKEEAKAPEAPRPSLIAPAKSPDAQRPRANGPIGSPSVNAPELPQRSASAFDAPAPAKKAPEPAAAPARSSVKSVEFTHVVPDAKEVYLLGPFLVRTGGRKAMTKTAASTWQTTIYLNTGAVYHYRFETVSVGGRRSTSGRRSLEVR